MKSSRKSSFNAVVYTILFLFLFNIFAIAGGAIFYFQAMTNLARDALKKRISIAIDVEMRRLQEILVEYSYWDEGYDRTIQSEDKEWVERNYGGYLLKTYGYTFVLIIKNSDRIVFSSFADTSPVITESYLSKYGLSQLILQSRNVRSLPHDIGGYVCIEGELYMVSVGPFIDESKKVPRPDNSYVVFGKKIENIYLDKLSRLYQLPSLDISSNPSPENESLTILDKSECPEFILVWEAPDANWAILSILIPVISLLGLCTFGFSWFLLKRHNQLRSIYEEHLYEMATRDGLTGAYNRGYFFNLAQEAFRQQRENIEHISVLMLDIDHFKSINDQHGHSIGDNNLKVFVKTLNSCVRGNDLIGRVGGEEFAVLLIEIDLTEAYAVAERIRDQIEKISNTGRDGIVPMTVSIGIAHGQKGTTFEETLKSADSFLYRAKSTGRNKVVTAAEQ